MLNQNDLLLKLREITHLAEMGNIQAAKDAIKQLDEDMSETVYDMKVASGEYEL